MRHQIISRLRSVGVPESLKVELASVTQNWYKSCGPEWTVTRLKHIKLMYLHYLSGDRKFNPGWISSKDGVPKGPFGYLFKIKVSQKVFYILQMYTLFLAKEPTIKQVEKFFKSVVSEDVKLPHIPQLFEVVDSLKHLVPNRLRMTYKDYPFSPSLFAPDRNGKSVPESPDNLFEDFQVGQVRDLFATDGIKDRVIDALDDLYEPILRGTLRESESQVVGKISLIQEPGFKARWIANPRRIYQILLLPLGKMIYRILSRLPWDCTYEQSKGIDFIKESFSQDKTVYSVDLSDASNHIPLRLQIRILKRFNLDRIDLSLFESVSRSPWLVPKCVKHHVSCEEIRWTKGQPLGIYPSFAAFALTHGVLLQALSQSIGENDAFRVLGDDVVINSQPLYTLYREYLNLLQVPVSEDKTISSRTVAEFAGHIVFKNKVFKPYKWRTITKGNALAVTSRVPKTFDLSDRLDFLSYLLKIAPEPIGLGENPDGLSLDERSKLLLPLYSILPKEEEITMVRHTHDVHFRSTRAYAQVFIPSDLVCNRDGDDQFVNKVPKWNPPDHTTVNEQFTCTGFAVYNLLLKKFRFCYTTASHDVFSELTFSDDYLESAFDHIYLCLKQAEKKDMINFFFRKLVYGEQRLAICSKSTISYMLRECYESLRDGWKRRTALSSDPGPSSKEIHRTGDLLRKAMESPKRGSHKLRPNS